MEKQDIYNYFNRENIYKLLKDRVSYLIPDKSDIELSLNVGGGSFTDGKKIVVGLPNIYLDDSYSEDDIFNILRGLIGHESQHINSSDFEVLKSFIENMSNYLENKHQIPKKYGRYIIKHIFNSIEDGRIEKILSCNFRGYINCLKYLNGTIWSAQPIETPNELNDFLYTITSISVIGLKPINYNKFYLNSELDSNINKIHNLIVKGINADTCRICSRICEDIVEIIAPYLKKLIKNKTEDDMDELLEKLNSDTEYTTSEEKDYNTSENSSPIHFNPNNDSTNNSSEKEDDNVLDEKKSPNSLNNRDENCDDNEKNNKSQCNEDSPGKSSNNKKEENKEDAIISPKTMDKFLDEIKEELSEEIKSLLNISKGTNKKNNTEKLNLDIKEKKELENIYKNEKVKKFEERSIVKLKFKLPSEVKSEGAIFKRQIERILINKKSTHRKNLRRGSLNMNDLWKLGIKEYNVFEKKARPNSSSYVAYLLQDGSGSMREDYKEYYSAKALSVLEEGLKGLIPLKIATFTAGRKIVHYIVKEFETNSKKNYSYNFFKQRDASGGNKDGYSIRVATRELMKRNETSKILFILSDGLPTDYNSDNIALLDVKEAVKEARKNGIKVIPIMFGNNNFRKKQRLKYEYMYERNIISCNPEDICSNIIKTMESIVKK